MSKDGVDYAWGRPGGAALQRAGMRFACRYLSHDTTGKNISRAEVDDLAAHGVSVVVVWETTQKRAAAGRAAGVDDAKDAVKQAAAAGMPSSRPIYFAVDYDAPEKDQASIDAYFRGVASVIGLARTGVYGGYWPLSRLKAAKLAAWFWQTDAWSGSNRLAGRHIHQHAATVKIGGVSCDKNTALTNDFGQWMPGTTPTPEPHVQEDDMDLTPANLKDIGHAVASYSHNDHPDVHATWQTAAEQATAAAEGVAALAQSAGTVTLSDEQVPALAAALAGNEGFVTALADALATNLAGRLQS
jgi:hypothetical protein